MCKIFRHTWQANPEPAQPHGGGLRRLPDGVTVPGQLLAPVKAAAPRLGLSPRLVHAADWLFGALTRKPASSRTW